MENNNKSCDDSSKMKKKIYHLDEINQKLLQTFRAIKKINKLFNIFASNLDGLNEMSKVLKPDAVNKTKFNRKILRLFKDWISLNNREKVQFIKEKDIFSDVLMNIGKKVLRDLFLMDDLKFLLSKANFRRYIEVKVKSYLGKEFLDFECASHIHLFEKMKKSLFNHPLLNEKNKILFVEEKNVVMENSEQLVEYKEKLLDESKAEDMIFLSNIDDRDNNFNTNNQNIIAENRNENIPNHYINEIINDNENKIRTPESEYNFLSNSTQDDILNIIINDKNCSHTDLEDKREKIFYLIHSYVSFYFFIDRRNFILRSLLIKC